MDVIVYQRRERRLQKSLSHDETSDNAIYALWEETDWNDMSSQKIYMLTADISALAFYFLNHSIGSAHHSSLSQIHNTLSRRGGARRDL